MFRQTMLNYRGYVTDFSVGFTAVCLQTADICHFAFYKAVQHH